MFTRQRRPLILTATAGLGLACSSGCESLPGNEEQQGAVAGGVVGAAAGAAVAGEGNRLLGALIGGAVGAGGGYLIGANWEKITGEEREDAQRAQREAQTNPVDPEDARRADTADINEDGFVTLDEIAAMEAAGLSDRQIVDRLEATNHYFELNPEQEQYLRDRGVSDAVILALRDMTQESRRLAGENLGDDRVGVADDD